MKKLSRPKRTPNDEHFDRIEKNLDKILDIVAKERYFPDRDREGVIAWFYTYWPNYWHLYEIILKYARSYTLSSRLIKFVLGGK